MVQEVDGGPPTEHNYCYKLPISGSEVFVKVGLWINAPVKRRFEPDHSRYGQC